MDESQLIARAFVAARRERRKLERYPGAPPRSMAEGYRIQDAALRIDDREVAGWKVGKIAAELAEPLGASRLAGPIFIDSVVQSEFDEITEMPVFSDGFAAVEAEFLLHVAPGWNGELPAQDDKLLELVDAVHAGIEIASSPYPYINDDGPAVTVSDYGNNFGLIVGPSLGHLDREAFDAVSVRVEINGVCVGIDTTANMLDGPVGSLRFLLGNLRERNIALEGGIWVSTGAITGVHPVEPGAVVSAKFADLAQVNCRIVSA